jgi:hypothetical protein
MVTRIQTRTALAALAGVALPSVAFAHPFGAKFAAMRMDVTVNRDLVEIHYLADVPNRIVQTAPRPGQSDAVDAMLAELSTGISVRADGATIALRRVSGGHVQSTDDTEVLELRLVGEWGECPRQLQVDNGNLPEIPTYFANSLLVGRGCDVIESNLLQIDQRGVVQHDLGGRWRLGDDNRTIRAHLVSNASWALPLRRRDKAVGAADAVRTPLYGLLTRSVGDLRVFGVGVVLAGFIGAGSGRGPRSAGYVLVACLVGLGAIGLPSSLAELGLGSLAVICGLLSLKPERPELAGAGMIALVTAQHDMLLGLLVCSACVCGLLLQRFSVPRAVACLSIVVGLAAVARGGLELWSSQ